MNSDFEIRPWGKFTVLHEEGAFKVKRIEVHPGKRLSLQRHQHRSEHWHVLRGVARVTVEGEEKEILQGGSADIPARAKHRMENPGTEVLVIVEIQRGDYFGEDDIERFDDDFGRSISPK